MQVFGGVLTQILSFIYIYFAFENEKFINLVGASGALSFLPLFMGINVAWYAHFIGWGIGCLYAKFYLKRADEIF